MRVADVVAAATRPRSPLEALLASPEQFALTTASPLQRAICRALDGVPLGALEQDATVTAAFGGAAAVQALPRAQPAELVLLAGIRSGKSLLAAACGVRAALTCDVSRLGPGEVPRVPIVSLSRDTARVTWQHVRGRVEASPVLRRLLVGEPTADTLRLRHPSGRPVEITVVAGARAAGSLVSRWLAGAIFDEAPRMVGASDGVVNLDDARLAIAGRMLPGAQVLLVGSPWAPFGPVYRLATEHHGRPSASVVVVRASGPAMNPAIWTPQVCADLRERNPDAYRVDVLAEWMAPQSSLFAEPELVACTRAAPLVVERAWGHEYIAVMDPATRGNAWTLVVITHDGRRRVVVLAREWLGSASAPLRPRAVLAEIGAVCRRYGVDTVTTDQWSADALRDLAEPEGVMLRTVTQSAHDRALAFEALRLSVVSREVELPPDETLRRDLLSVRRRTTQSGVTIDLPLTSDGRHADYAAALALSMGVALSVPAGGEAPAPRGTADAERQAADAHFARAVERSAQRIREEAPDYAVNPYEQDPSWIWGPGR